MPCGRGSATVALSQIAGINALVWSYDRYYAKEEWARVSLKSWKKNVTNGPRWDSDPLTSNQIAHPYHGSLYFNFARSNGFDYWNSFAFSVAGSAMWELFGEVSAPSPNDLMTTSIGGAALGETLFRLSDAILAARRMPSWIRRSASALLNPAGSVSSALGAEAHATSMPSSVRTTFAVGAGTSPNQSGDTWRPILSVDVRYGFLASDEVERPFDVMRFGFKAGLSGGSSVNRVESQGALSSAILAHGRTAIGIFQHFDYLHTPAVELGGQSVAVGITDRRSLSTQLSLTTTLHGGILVFGSTRERRVKAATRRNDYGPGGIMKFEADIAFRDNEIFRVRADTYLLQSVTNSRARHVAFTGSAEFSVPLLHGLSLSAASEVSYGGGNGVVSSTSSGTRLTVRVGV
ncbi:MAG: DUF3943 domain-containing protein [Rhodothermia bacterium]|nr:DUF3943 domain-containing protein [Rhodothermia bacterium]